MLSRLTVFVFFTYLVQLSALATPLPVEHFANLPDVSNLSLSPNGKKLVSFVRIDAAGNKGIAIQVTQLKTGKQDFVLFTDNTKYFLNNVNWKDDKTLLVTTMYPSERDTWTGVSQLRYKTREFRLLIINTETGEVSPPFGPNYLKKYKILPNVLSQVVDTLPNDPDHILMSIPSISAGFPSWPIVIKLNINTLHKTTVQNAEIKTSVWATDSQHRVRISVKQDNELISNNIRDIKTDTWRELWPYEMFTKEEVNVLGFDKDPNVIYVSAYHNDYKAVFKVDLNDKELTRELVYADANYDVNGQLVYSKKDQRILGIGSGKEEGTKFIDPTFSSIQASVDKALPNKRNFIYSITQDENKYLVYSTGPTESGTYYIGTRNPTSLNAIAYRYNKLSPDTLSNVTKMEYKARDGLSIEAYLTLPKNVKAQNLPTLMFPHGGPIGRDSKSFDYWAQFFANRGYAVLQMNFRGSSGQGLTFRNSGLKKWGKEMQDDIQDGALALIKQGITDPNRICIVGASYGGYASLMGIVKTPDFYQCAISVNGVSNVFDLVKDNRVFWQSYNVVDEQIGNDNQTLREISPVNYADKIKVPVLLIHGELDRQVDIKHSYQMRDALQKANKEVIFIEQAGEDHYLSSEKMRVQAFKAMDAFLNDNLPVIKK
ncbi:S9 family peptidase [Paraglaciecola aquimarina]|uniref:S9 family peptidase n=1 Tax=Paraglaciecola algarum TaxID=3050085 RepID=A0ABS9D516_9ALTE|nr:S9 family peptidase [Paraglaciecola sp. G1-23]MCF2948033.1 S9 family peptidase [Paraglaciecola sp. G1-23]